MSPAGRRVALATVLACGLVALTHALDCRLADALGPRRLQKMSGPVQGGTETKHHSFVESLVMMVAGFILMVMAVGILFLNEGRLVRMEELLAAAGQRAVTVDPAQVDTACEGKVVHACATLAASAALQDPIVKAEAPAGSIKFRRVIEQYAWVEKKEEEQGQTRYTYSLQWTADPEPSSGFNNKSYVNPPLEIRGKITYAKDAQFGAFRMPLKGVGKVDDWTSDGLGPALRQLALPGYGQRPANVAAADAIASGVWQTEAGRDVKTEWAYYRPFSAAAGQSPADECGDVRAALLCVPAGEASVLAVQRGQTFEAFSYQTKSVIPRIGRAQTADFNLVSQARPEWPEPELEDPEKDWEDPPGVADDLKRGVAAVGEANWPELWASWGCCCIGCALAGVFMEGAAPSEVFVVARGRKSKDQLLEAAGGESHTMVLMLRVFGFLLLWGGLDLLLDPIYTLLRYIPFLGPLIVYGMGILTFLAACTCSSVVVGCAWITYRPLLGLLVLSVPVAIFYLTQPGDDGLVGHGVHA